MTNNQKDHEQINFIEIILGHVGQIDAFQPDQPLRLFQAAHTPTLFSHRHLSKTCKLMLPTQGFVSFLTPRDGSSSRTGPLPPLLGRGGMPQTQNHHTPKTPLLLKKISHKSIRLYISTLACSLYFYRSTWQLLGLWESFQLTLVGIESYHNDVHPEGDQQKAQPRISDSHKTLGMRNYYLWKLVEKNQLMSAENLVRQFSTAWNIPTASHWCKQLRIQINKQLA